MTFDRKLKEGARAQDLVDRLQLLHDRLRREQVRDETVRDFALRGFIFSIVIWVVCVAYRWL